MSTLRPAEYTSESSDAQASSLKLLSSCRPEKISSLFSSFCIEKTNLLRSVGFGGLLKLPSSPLINLELCLWLIQRLDLVNKCLHLPGNVVLPFDDPDVYLVFGIPCQGRSVSIEHQISKESVASFTNKLFTESISTSLTISSLEEILTKDYGHYMSEHEKISFSIAAILYAVTYLLAPGNCHEFPNHLISNFLDDVNPFEINWASLVLSGLDGASRDARTKITNGHKRIKLLGCCLFIQVFYLDNLSFGPSSPKHNSFPRVSAYSSDVIDQLNISDGIATSQDELMIFGYKKIRPAFEVSYTRAWSAHANMRRNLEQLSQDDLHKCIDIMSQGMHILKDFFECHERLNISILEGSTGFTRGGYLHLKCRLNDIMDELSMKTTDFLSECSLGYVCQPGATSSQTRLSTGLTFQRTVNSSTRSVSLQRIKVYRRAQNLKSLFTSCLTPQEAIMFLCVLQLAEHGQRFSSNSQLQRKNVTSHSKFPLYFCDQMFEHPDVSSENKYSCYVWMTNHNMPTYEREREWIVFPYPRPIRISGTVVSNCLKLNGHFIVPMMDAIMLVWSYLDEKFYTQYLESEEPHNIWRHFLPASFAELVINGSDYLGSYAVQASFIGDHIAYNVEDCQQIVLPVLGKDNSWSCFFWDFKSKNITVLDPVLMRSPPARAREKHHSTVLELHTALFKCIHNFFSGWDADQNGWIDTYCTNVSYKSSPKNSGLYVAHYARSFSGTKGLAWKLSEPHEDSLCFARGEILYNFITCPLNKGYKSDRLLQRFNFHCII